jgi:hypothetical protein
MTRAIAALAAAVIALAEARAGEVRGVVRFEGAAPPSRRVAVTKDQRTCGEELPDEGLVLADGKLANVIVTVRGAPAAPPSRASLDQRGCRFVPHVQVVPVGSMLDLLNGDPLLHSVHGWAGRITRFDVPMSSERARSPAPLDKPGLIAVRCDVHGWMAAWVLVADSPAAVSGADGAFAIGGVPAGTYTVTAWHERLGERTAQVKVPPDGAARVDFAYGG